MRAQGAVAGPRRGAARVAAALSALAAPLTVAACSGSLPKGVSSAPVLSVATGLWPLAAAASEIGGAKVAVDDLVPAGTDPFGYQPGSAGTRILQSAGLIVEIGGGFQPGIEQAAEGAPRVLRLGRTAVGQDPYVWLDPSTMSSAVGSIAAAMAAANPAAAPLYQRNLGALQDSIRSLGIDYRSTLAACPGTVIVTPDEAFTAMAADYGLKDHVVRPTATAEQISTEKTALQTGGRAAILTQPWVDNGGVQRLAAAGGWKGHAVNTLASAPATGTAAQNTYLARMEEILGVISGALGCTSQQ